MSIRQRTEDTEDEGYEVRKMIFASLNKEAKALGLKDISETFSDGEEEVFGILPKDYKTKRVVEVTLREVDIDEAIEKVEQANQ